MIQSLKWQESLPRHCRHIQWPAGAWPWGDHRLSPPCSGRTGRSRCAWACTCPAAELPLKHRHTTHAQDFVTAAWTPGAHLPQSRLLTNRSQLGISIRGQRQSDVSWWSPSSSSIPYFPVHVVILRCIPFLGACTILLPLWFYPYKLNQHSWEHALNRPPTWSPSTNTVKYKKTKVIKLLI